MIAALAKIAVRVGGVLLLLALLFVLNVSRAGKGPAGCPSNCARPGRPSNDMLRLLSLNVLHGHPEFQDLDRRLELISGEMERLEVDIALLQEVPWTRRLGSATEFLAEAAGLNYLYLRANGNRSLIFFEEGEAILSRFPLKEPQAVELEPQAGFFEHRVALKATAETPWGDLDLVVTHLTNGRPSINARQADSLAAFVERSSFGPAVVAGDFNARESSPQILSLTTTWLDAFRTANPSAPGLTCCVGDLRAGPEEPLEKRIDYLFLVRQEEGPFQLGQVSRIFDQPFQVDGRWQWASDHLGLLATLEPTSMLPSR